MQSQGNLGLEKMCELAGLSRATFYRRLQQQDPVMVNQELRDAIQRICIGH